VKKKVHKYEGKHGVVAYDSARCIHAAECVKGLPAVFDPDRRPWVDPDAADPAELKMVVDRCPTGALAFEAASGAGGDDDSLERLLQIQPDGPLYFRGLVDLLGPAGESLGRESRAAFCRCGASQNKPFCDGRHAEAGFADPGDVDDLRVDDEVDLDTDEAIKVVLANNGPLLFQGPIEIRNSGGSPCYRGRMVALCRCGASQNKPYCDGSHSSAGFSSD